MDSLKGKLLLASTTLRDPNFVKSVVLMVQHDSDGALGLILNRPTQLTVRAAWEQVSDSPCKAQGVIYQGGPVEVSLMVVHADEEAAQVRVCDGVYFTTDPDQIERLMAQGTDPAKFFVGYAGWDAGQLESELQQHAWVIGTASAAIVFANDDRLWHTLMTIQRWAAVGVRTPSTRIVPTDPSMN